MRSGIKTNNRTIATEFAEAISSFDISEVANLLSDNGEFAVPNEKYEIVKSGKSEFVDWLSSCYKKFSFSRLFRKKLSFTIVQCMHCINENPIIIIEAGKFPVFSGNQARNEHSGMVIKSVGNKITGIELCFLIMKTENPFIYEKRCLKPDL
jgi:hypothetical protein